jgi:glucose-6-phosphate 1-epimerase
MRMSSGNLRALSSRFGGHGVAFCEGPGGLESVEIENRHATARVALQGAQLLAWQPREEEPVIWVSPVARYEPGVAIRGGIPICWPWFGPHPTDPAQPQHGFARTAAWRVVAVDRLYDDRTRLTLRLPDGHGSATWPHETELLCMITVGRALELDLVTRNAGPAPITVSQAFHAYFRVSDYERVTVHGLEGCRFLDKVDGGEGVQDRPLRLSGRTDRLFAESVRDIVLEDPGLGRAIRVARRNSHSAVVWNPGLDGASPASDFGPDGSRGMLCLETANAGPDTVRLEPHAVHLLFSRYTVGPVG